MIYQSLLPHRENWELDMDLNTDLELLLEVLLRRWGVTKIRKKNIIYEYFNFVKRMVAIKPREIAKSKEFCVPTEYEQALQYFEQDARTGKNLNKYLSDSILKPAEPDDLLNDWNIVHFHLTKRFRNDGFAKRSNYQIFAWITDECLYMIQIYPHKEPYLYSKQEILQIVEHNWPQLLEPYRVPGAIKLTEKLDDQAYADCHKAHISTMVQIGKNKVYYAMGGGYMSDGSSSEALRNADFWIERMRICENIIRKNMKKITSVIRNLRSKVDSNYKIKMTMLPNNANCITVVELHNLVGIQLLLDKELLRIYRIEEECKYQMHEKNIYKYF